MSMNYLPTHQALIETALKRLNLWPSHRTQLPPPLSVETGVAGESTVYLFRLPSGKNNHSLGLVAKFESNRDRAKREWAAISELRNEYRQFQHGLLLPIEGNAEADGVIMFLLAGQDRPGMECTSLLKVLQKQLADALPNCRASLEQTISCLDHFHWNAHWSDPSSEATVRKWRDIFALDGSSLGEALNALRKTGVVEGGKPGLIRVRERTLVDPTTRLSALSDRSIGWCKWGRVHGDLNLTNVLCLLDDARKSWAAYVIDFSHTRAGMPIALDYAKVEVEFWHNVFFDLDSDGDLALLTLNTLGFLEGKMPAFPRETNVAVRNFVEILCWWRNKAFEKLGSGANTRYMLIDYFICMFFHAVRALQWPDVRSAHRKTLVLSLVATQLSQTLNDIDSGRYSQEPTEQFPIAPKTITLGDAVWSEGRSTTSWRSTVTSRSETDPYVKPVYETA